jgi:hypothetical protein
VEPEVQGFTYGKQVKERKISGGTSSSPLFERTWGDRLSCAAVHIDLVLVVRVGVAIVFLPFCSCLFVSVCNNNQKFLIEPALGFGNSRGGPLIVIVRSGDFRYAIQVNAE